VEETVRLLLGRRDPLHAAGVAALTAKGAPPLLMTIEVEPVSLALFDELLCGEGEFGHTHRFGDKILGDAGLSPGCCHCVIAPPSAPFFAAKLSGSRSVGD
jgi:hypothetical protein